MGRNGVRSRCSLAVPRSGVREEVRVFRAGRSSFWRPGRAARAPDLSPLDSCSLALIPLHVVSQILCQAVSVTS